MTISFRIEFVQLCRIAFKIADKYDRADSMGARDACAEIVCSWVKDNEILHRKYNNRETYRRIVYLNNGIGSGKTYNGSRNWL